MPPSPGQAPRPASVPVAGRNGDAFAFALGVIGMLCFSGTLPASRLAVPFLDPWFLTMGRAALAGVLAVLILLVRRRRFPPRADWVPLLLASLTLTFGFPLCLAFASVTVPATHGGVVVAILPLAVAVTAGLVAGERPSAGFWIAALAGSAVVVIFALRHAGAEGARTGDFLLLGAVASGAVGYTYAGKLSMRMPGWEVICWAVAMALPIAVPATILLWPADATTVPPFAWGAMVYMGLFSQLVGFFFWNAGMARAGIARIGQLQLLQPFFIVGIAAVVNGEPVELETLFFATAVIATVLLGQRMRVRRS